MNCAQYTTVHQIKINVQYNIIRTLFYTYIEKCMPNFRDAKQSPWKSCSLWQPYRLPPPSIFSLSVPNRPMVACYHYLRGVKLGLFPFLYPCNKIQAGEQNTLPCLLSLVYFFSKTRVFYPPSPIFNEVMMADFPELCCIPYIHNLCHNDKL